MAPRGVAHEEGEARLAVVRQVDEAGRDPQLFEAPQPPAAVAVAGSEGRAPSQGDNALHPSLGDLKQLLRCAALLGPRRSISLPLLVHHVLRRFVDDSERLSQSGKGTPLCLARPRVATIAKQNKPRVECPCASRPSRGGAAKYLSKY